MDAPLKRISLMIREDQYDRVSKKGLNLSGLTRDLLDDYFSEHKITLAVSEDTADLYDKIVSNTGTSDSDLEDYFKEALGKLLEKKISEMQALADLSFRKNKKAKK